jgi:hypothetical protein
VSEIAVLITSVVGALTAAGGAVTWLWAKVEARFKDVEQKLEDCEKRELRQKDTTAKHLIVIELLWQEVERRTRGPNPVLERAGKLLDDLKQAQEKKP